jgi:hypothetical protein
MNQPLILTSILGLKWPVIFSILLEASPHLSRLTVHIHLPILPNHISQLSSPPTFCLMCSISLSTFQLCFKIALLICFVCRVTYELFKLELIFKILNNPPSSILSPSGHVKCQHAMWTYKHRSTVGQKKVPIDFIQFSTILQIVT